MNLLVNSILVKAEMKPHAKGKGFALHLFITSNNNQADPVHAMIEKALRLRCPAVMSWREPKEGFSEIRVAEHTSLEVVDLLRMNGFGVIEQPINQ